MTNLSSKVMSTCYLLLRKITERLTLTVRQRSGQIAGQKVPERDWEVPWKCQRWWTEVATMWQTSIPPGKGKPQMWLLTQLAQGLCRLLLWRWTRWHPSLSSATMWADACGGCQPKSAGNLVTPTGHRIWRQKSWNRRCGETRPFCVCVYVFSPHLHGWEPAPATRSHMWFVCLISGWPVGHWSPTPVMGPNHCHFLTLRLLAHWHEGGNAHWPSGHKQPWTLGTHRQSPLHGQLQWSGRVPWPGEREEAAVGQWRCWPHKCTLQRERSWS